MLLETVKLMSKFKATGVLRFLGAVPGLLLVSLAQAQPAPLNLPFLIEQASLNHPSMQSARLDSRASAEDLVAARRQRLPTVSAVIEDGSDTTTSSASRAVRLEQNLWDAGRTTARIAEAQASTDIGQARVYIQYQLLAIQAVNAWQSLLASHAKVEVAQATLVRLNAYRAQMQRRIEAEVSPAIDLELVQSRMLQTQVELTNAQTGVKTAITKLEQVSGVIGLAAHMSKLQPIPGLSATAHMPTLLNSTDWTLAASNHPSVAKARFDHAAATHRIRAKQAEQWPQVYARVDQPVAGANSKTAAFVGLRYTPGAGFSTLAEAQALASRAASLAQGTEAAFREVLEAMQNDHDEFFNNRQRVEALLSAVDGSEKVLSSYGRQFTASRKTWQDLMNAVREVAQNQYALADANAAMYGALHRLQIRSGQGVSTVAAEAPNK